MTLSTPITNTYQRLAVSPIIIMSALTFTAAQAPLHASAQASIEASAQAEEQPEFCGQIPRVGWANYEKLDVSDDWFQVYQLHDDLYAISEPYQWQEVISYLIIGESRALLFDSGNGMGDIKRVVDALTPLSVTVLASHSHIDHVGGHYQFETVLAPETAFTNDRAKGRGNAFVAEEASTAALCRPLPNGVTEDNHRTRAFTPTARVEEGSKIDLGGTVLTVMMIPGHTPDSLMLLDTAKGRLFTGDSYYKGPIWLYASETDLPAYARSIGRMADLAPTLTSIHGAHNEPYSDPAELLKVRNAFTAIMAGTRKPDEVLGTQAIYQFGTFDLLMQKDHDHK
ncbi:MBL fold metallo-hydrolase [Kordiimonas sp. SCSIO 12610]|uniref:MBL fold metallo-hydrolase n=1 Tax=Kordiimonas sp. SCSIO 12610 TaxID=2829597 RepID=UPI00210B52B7|nr:MBL fold metallo-hydrolase [Kordiimonas sp. SCSIO 12610]UTW56221.1 MBL fold metallo-hydrolase [Kordiimonas sp. SCSIO 12610]